MISWRLDSARLNFSRLRDSIFERCHCVPNVVSRRLDVVGSRGADVRVLQDSLNHHIRHSQAVQIAPQATPGSVPAVPLGNPTSKPAQATETSQKGTSGARIEDSLSGVRQAFTDTAGGARRGG